MSLPKRDMDGWMNTYIHTYIHIYIRTYVLTCTYVSTYVHTYIREPDSGATVNTVSAAFRLPNLSIQVITELQMDQHWLFIRRPAGERHNYWNYLWTNTENTGMCFYKNVQFQTSVNQFKKNPTALKQWSQNCWAWKRELPWQIHKITAKKKNTKNAIWIFKHHWVVS